jgi:ankyrin repeat protein
MRLKGDTFVLFLLFFFLFFLPFLSYTPLMYAASVDNFEAVQVLLAAGANSNESSLGQTPLHIASTKGNLRIVVALLENGADPNMKDAGKGRVTPILSFAGC